MGYSYLYVILAYLLVMTGYNIYRSRQVKSQDDFMVAGRSLSLTKMVFTLVCTWIGSGTFIAGAEFASYAGWSAVWQPAGAFLGIAVIYFVAAKIRTFGQYTVGDILEARYGRFARLFGAIALIIAFTTIVSRQPAAFLNLLAVRDDRLGPEVIVTLAGKREELGAMLQCLHRRFLPSLVVRHAGDVSEGEFPALDGQPTAYVCAGGACRPPVTSVEGVEELLDIVS